MIAAMTLLVVGSLVLVLGVWYARERRRSESLVQELCAEWLRFLSEQARLCEERDAERDRRAAKLGKVRGAEIDPFSEADYAGLAEDEKRGKRFAARLRGPESSASRWVGAEFGARYKTKGFSAFYEAEPDTLHLFRCFLEQRQGANVFRLQPFDDYDEIRWWQLKYAECPAFEPVGFLTATHWLLVVPVIFWLLSLDLEWSDAVRALLRHPVSSR